MGTALYAELSKRVTELERALRDERAALDRERQAVALERRRCALLEDSVKRAYRLAAYGVWPDPLATKDPP